MGAVFSIFGGIYYWFYKITGVTYSEILSQIHFWVFFTGVNITFFPMHYLGVAGMPRRIPDYPDAFYTFNKIASWGSEISGFSLLIFLVILIEAFDTNNTLGLAAENFRRALKKMLIRIMLVFKELFILGWVISKQINLTIEKILKIIL